MIPDRLVSILMLEIKAKRDLARQQNKTKESENPLYNIAVYDSPLMILLIFFFPLKLQISIILKVLKLVSAEFSL